MERILVTVYKPADGRDCTNGGITCNRMTLMLYSGNKEECIAEATKRNELNEALYLNKRILWDEQHYFAEPLERGKGCQMFGGNFVYSCDTRFANMCEDRTHRPLPVHDRYELNTNMSD